MKIPAKLAKLLEGTSSAEEEKKIIEKYLSDEAAALSDDELDRICGGDPGLKMPEEVVDYTCIGDVEATPTSDRNCNQNCYSIPVGTGIDICYPCLD